MVESLPSAAGVTSRASTGWLVVWRKVSDRPGETDNDLTWLWTVRAEVPSTTNATPPRDLFFDHGNHGIVEGADEKRRDVDER